MSSVFDFIAARIKVDPEKKCWIWGNGKSPVDYARTSRGGTKMRAHRFVFESFVGPIPDGLVIDHLCRVLRCVNPTHLEPVTQGENTLRGFGACANNARKTKCKRGHEFSLLPDGRRICLTCKHDAKIADYYANAEARRAYSREYAQKNSEAICAKRREAYKQKRAAR